MLINQLFSGLHFYIIFSLFAFIGYAVSSSLFKGRMLSYVTAKPIGLVVSAYFVWILGFFHILNYQATWLIWILLILGSVIAAFVSRHELKALRASWKKILLVEGLTVLVYLVYLIVRSHNATSSNGAESFMDMTLLSGVSKTNFFPFLDSWYAGKTINYYYYGSYLMSLIGNLGNIPYFLTYNFSLGLIYCQSILLSGSLVYALSKSKLAAALGAFLVTSAGTLFFANCVLRQWMLEGDQVCSYASSTRLYSPSYIINEIPSYSFIVGDLHAHLLALPFFILNLILLFAFSRQAKPTVALCGTFALTLATSGMINAWDAITIGALFVILLFVKSSQSKKWVGYGLLTLAATYSLLSPALATFQSPVLGLGFAPVYVAAHALVDVQYPTPTPAIIGMWALFLVAIAAALIFRRKVTQYGTFIVVLCVVSVGIIIGVELFFIKDIYSVSNPPYFRANTTFKFGYHAWTMLSIIFAAVLSQWIFPLHKEHKSSWKFIPVLLVVVAVSGGVYFPYQALAQYYAPNAAIKPDLDASLWLKRSAPGDHEAVQYINEYLPNRMVIAEAVGDSYTTFGRISAYTGMITPMGWKTHEWTWRFQGKGAENAPKGVTVETGYSAIAVVSDDIRRLYITQNLEDATNIIERYGIQYVFIGSLERSTYENLNEEKFYKLGKVVFESGDSILFKLNIQ